MTSTVIKEKDNTIFQTNHISISSGVETFGNKESFFKMLFKFPTYEADAGAKIKQAFIQQDVRRLEILAHTLKGTASVIHAIQLQSLANELESAIKDRSANIGYLIKMLDKEIGAVLAEIAKLKDSSHLI
ncbi:MAG: Hpt domain-containing protein [Gammaproteobacteria bacterium]|nr:Hpt domain-containing protein [Gammaproteobacteria bacterium]MDH5592264.1 Hpt domain-containing protein [Gammaproteobacteria bacterium]